LLLIRQLADTQAITDIYSQAESRLTAVSTKRLLCAAGLVSLLTACSHDNQTPTAPGSPAPSITYSLTGSVIDRASRMAIVGATVAVADGPNAGKSATTSDSGAYTFSALQQSDFTVSVSMQNYVTLSTKISLTANQTQTFALDAKPKDTPPPPPPTSCSYDLSVGRTIDGYPNGSTFTVTVTTGAECAWTVSTDSTSWIHLQDAVSGTGTGTFTFATDANNSAATRTGTVTYADKVITLNQTPNLVVTVTGDTPRVGGGAVPFSAGARFGDGSMTVVTAQAAWDSSAPSVATVTAAGLVEAVSAGTADVRAIYRGITGSARITVPVVFLHNTLVGAGATSYPGGYSPQETGGIAGYYAVSDDFTAAITTRVNVVAWQGIYCRVHNPDLTIAPVPDATEFRVGFYADNGGRPDSILGQEYHFNRGATNERLEANVPGSCSSGPNNGVSGLYNYEVTLPSPFSVTASTRYWLQIRAYYAAATSPLIWLWRFGSTDNGISYPGPAGAIGRDLGFSVR
jgi:hypothetical protein